jgi:Flp pilus assembly protein TadB
MPTIVGLGSLAWAVAAVVLLVAGGTGTPFVVCVVGAVLGGLGYAVFRWQRAAARRGSRTAQQGLD